MCQFLKQWHSLQLVMIFLVLLGFITPIYLKYTDRPSTDPPLLMNFIIHSKKLTKIMPSSSITSWQIDGKNSRNSDRLYFLGLQDHCRWWLSYEIKRCLLLGRKATTNLDSILKSRDITLPTKVHLVKAMVFPVVFYGCESWTIKKLSADELMLLNYCVAEDSWESLGTARRSNQSILQEISSEYSLKGLMLKLKLQYFDHLMPRTFSLEPDAWKDWRQEEKVTTEDKMVGVHHQLSGHEFKRVLGVDDGQGSLSCCSPWGRKELDRTEQLTWTETFQTLTFQ